MDNMDKLKRITQIIESCKTKDQIESCYSFSNTKATFFSQEDDDSRLIINDMINEKAKSMHLLN